MGRQLTEREVEERSFWQAMPLVALMLLLVWWLSGCASLEQPRRECDERSVAELVARCTALVRLECSPDPEKPCAAEDTCDAELAQLCPKAVPQ